MDCCVVNRCVPLRILAINLHSVLYQVFAEFVLGEAGCQMESSGGGVVFVGDGSLEVGTHSQLQAVCQRFQLAIDGKQVEWGHLIFQDELWAKDLIKQYYQYLDRAKFFLGLEDLVQQEIPKPVDFVSVLPIEELVLHHWAEEVSKV